MLLLVRCCVEVAYAEAAGGIGKCVGLRRGHTDGARRALAIHLGEAPRSGQIEFGRGRALRVQYGCHCRSDGRTPVGSLMLRNPAGAGPKRLETLIALRVEDGSPPGVEPDPQAVAPSR